MRWCTAPVKHCFESALFWPFFSQGIDFWSILGPKGDQIGLQNRSQNDKIGFWFHLGAPGCAREQFWVDFGGVLRPLGSILAPFWGYRGSKKCKLQRISENSSKQQQTAQKSCKYKAQSLKLKAWSSKVKAQTSELKLKAQSSKLKARSSNLKGQSSNLRAQSSKLKAQSSNLKAQSSKLEA